MRRALAGGFAVVGLIFAGAPGIALGADGDEGSWIDDVNDAAAVTPDSVNVGALEAGGSIQIESGPCGDQTLSIDTSLAVVANPSRTFGRAGVGATVKAGVAAQYESNMTAEQLDALRAGEIPLPSPFDLDTLQPGMSVVLNEEVFTSLGLTGSYKLLTGTATVSRSSGNVVGVTRTTDGAIEVVIGPSEGVAQELFLGIGRDGFRAGIFNGEDHDSWTLQTYRFEDTPEGRAAYEQLLATGEAPAGTPSEQIVQGDSTYVAGVRAEIPNASWDFPTGQNDGTWKVTTHADGSTTTEVTLTYDSRSYGFGDVTVTREFDAQGNERTDAREVVVRISNVPPEVVQGLDVAFTGNEDAPVPEGPQDVVIRLDGDDYDALVQRAQQRVEGDPSIGSLTIIDDIAESTDPLLVGRLLIMQGNLGDLYPLAVPDANPIVPLPGGVASHAAGTCPEPSTRAPPAPTEVATAGNNVARDAATTAVAPEGQPSSGDSTGGGQRR